VLCLKLSYLQIHCTFLLVF